LWQRCKHYMSTSANLRITNRFDRVVTIGAKENLPCTSRVSLFSFAPLSRLGPCLLMSARSSVSGRRFLDGRLDNRRSRRRPYILSSDKTEALENCGYQRPPESSLEPGLLVPLLPSTVCHSHVRASSRGPRGQEYARSLPRYKQ